MSNLALECPAHHHAIHDSKWDVTLHPDGTMTYTRHGITLTSQPRAARRFTPTEPPPRGRPTRHRPTHRYRDGNTGTGSPPQPEPPPPQPEREDDLPF